MNTNKDILNELLAISPVVAAIPRVNVYNTYDNYFEEIQAVVMAKVKGSLLSTTNEYALPVGYFEKLSADILQKVKTYDVTEELKNVSSTVANIGNRNVYSVADNYFENLNLQKGIATDVTAELKNISITVSNIGNKNIYSVADNYFESLKVNVSEKQPAKVIAFGKRSILKLAAAAVVTGILGLGIFTFVNKQSTTNVETAAIIKAADNIITTNSFDATFATLTDKDLEKYLVQNGEDVNASMVASAAENAELPAAIDYYLDPNTLNDFLDDNNLKN